MWAPGKAAAAARAPPRPCPTRRLAPKLPLSSAHIWPSDASPAAAQEPKFPCQQAQTDSLSHSEEPPTGRPMSRPRLRLLVAQFDGRKWPVERYFCSQQRLLASCRNNFSTSRQDNDLSNVMSCPRRACSSTRLFDCDKSGSFFSPRFGIISCPQTSGSRFKTSTAHRRRP